jgi:hypothetical protein
MGQKAGIDLALYYSDYNCNKPCPKYARGAQNIITQIVDT